MMPVIVRARWPPDHLDLVTGHLPGGDLGRMAYCPADRTFPGKEQ
jgi:hypothetical protein